MTSLLVPARRPQTQTGQLFQLLVSFRAVVSHKRCLDHNNLNNYRPVSNLCFIAKILEKLV